MVIDSQSVNGADTVGSDSPGYDTGKKINGGKGFIVTDALGLWITVWVLAASSQDRDGAKGALVAAALIAPSMRYVFVDSGFAGRLVDWPATSSPSPSTWAVTEREGSRRSARTSAG